MTQYFFSDEENDKHSIYNCEHSSHEFWKDCAHEENKFDSVEDLLSELDSLHIS